MSSTPELEKPVKRSSASEVPTGARGFPGQSSEKAATTLYELYKLRIPPRVPYTLSILFAEEIEWLHRGGLNRPPILTK